MTVPTLSGVAQATGDPSWGVEFLPTLSGFSAGALLVIIGATEGTITGVSDGSWTLLGATTPVLQLAVYYKQAAGGDTIPTFSLNGFYRYSWTSFYVASGFDTGSPLEGFMAGSGTADNPVAPSTTPTATRDHAWITSFVHGGDGSAGDSFTAPSGHTLLGAGHSVDFLDHAAARKDFTAAGATGTAQYTFAPGNNWQSISFLVRPTGGGGGGGSGSIAVRDRYAPRGLNRGLAA